MTIGKLPEDLKTELDEINAHIDVCLQHFRCDTNKRPEIMILAWYLDWAREYESLAMQIPRPE
jgi:hypothetical protein